MSRCEHGFMKGLCAVEACPHWDGKFEPKPMTWHCAICGDQGHTAKLCNKTAVGRRRLSHRRQA